MKKFVLIDGNSLLNRAYYATSEMRTKNGLPTNAIFGFTQLILNILKDNKSDYFLVAFDRKAPTFRHKMYDGYKATRKGMPDELAAQVAPVKELLSAMHIAMYEQDGIEADDIMGTLSHKYDGVHSYIYTGDRDAFQLVDDNTDIYFTKRGVSDLLKLNVSNFREEVGYDPLQTIDMKSLMGDSSDNIPGVMGVGEKTALDLVTKYKSLDNIYENIGDLKGGLQTKLNNNKDMAYLSYKLATIKRDCDIDINLDECKTPLSFGTEVKKKFAEFEFNKFMNSKLFDNAPGEVIESVSLPQKIHTESEVEVLEFIDKSLKLYIYLDDKLAQFYDGGKIYEVEYSDDLFATFSINNFTNVLNAAFSKEGKNIVMFDCKSALHYLDDLGVECRCFMDDISVMAYLTDSPLKNTLKSECDLRLIDMQYASYVVGLIYNEVDKRLEGDIRKLYDEIEKPLICVLFSMEKEGITVSLDELNKLGAKYNADILDMQEKIYDLSGCRFNISSPAQLGHVLFDTLKLPSGKKNKKGNYSTSAEVLESLQDDSEVVRCVLKYRQSVKFYSTYVEGFKPLIGQDGKIHTTYNQTVTTTGRLSSTNPNMQNIPVRDEEGKELRKMFVSKEGNILIDADYSQIELRLLAHFSKCPKLIEAYNNGEDVHTLTATQVFGVSPLEVTPKMRREAKAVNFGIIYGISDFGLSRNLSIPLGKARDYIQGYFESYKEVKEFMDKNVEFAKEHGYVTTLTGRKRIIPELTSSNYNTRQFGERAAMNMPLQGTSADIIKIAMINVAKSIKEHGLKSKLILQVHDELVIEAPMEEQQIASQILKDEMENAVHLLVPLTVEVKVGTNWYDSK